MSFNQSFFRNRLYPYPIARYLYTANATFSYIATIAMAFAFDGAMHALYMSKKHLMLVRISAVMMFLFVVIEQISAILSGIMGVEYMSSATFGAVFVLISIPIDVMFIRSGRALSLQLLKSPARDNTAATKFARRVVLCGVCGIITMIVTIVFVLVAPISLNHWFTSYFAGRISQAVLGIIRSSAFIPKNSKLDQLLNPLISPLSILHKGPRIVPVAK